MAGIDLSSDPFKDDKRETRVFGEDVYDEVSKFSGLSTTDLPESKSNNVSFMKVEELAYDCKNLLAVSDKFICYSVTQKKNLLRLIDTISGEKIILRSHESSVADLKFASADNEVICSVDNGSSNVAHTVVWSKDNSTDKVAFNPTCKLNIRAVIVKPHPYQSNLWAVTDKRNVGIFSTTRHNENVNSYADLSLKATFEAETVTDIAFTSSGNQLVVALRVSDEQSYIQVLQINKNENIIRGTETFTKLFAANQSKVYIENLMSIQCIGSYLITASKNTSSQLDQVRNVNYTIQVWKGYDDLCIPATSSSQSVILQLPLFTSTRYSTVSTSLQNPLLECTLSISPRHNKCLIFSSRKSSYVVCLAVSPASHASIPLYHVTMLSLKAPVVSMDVTVILGQEHHSDEEGEHLEMSCFQEEASDQASVQQYHVLVNNLFDYSKYQQSSKSRSSTNLSNLGNSIVFDNSNNNANTATSTEAKGKTILSLLTNANKQVSESSSNSNFLDDLNKLSIQNNTALDSSRSNKSLSSATTTTTPSTKFPLPSTINPEPNNNSNNVITSSSSEPILLTPSGITAGKSILNSLASKKDTAPKEDTKKDTKDSGIPSFLNIDATNSTPKGASILSMIKENSTTTTPITSIKATTETKTPIIESKVTTASGKKVEKLITEITSSTSSSTIVKSDSAKSLKEDVNAVSFSTPIVPAATKSTTTTPSNSKATKSKETNNDEVNNIDVASLAEIKELLKALAKNTSSNSNGNSINNSKEIQLLKDDLLKEIKLSHSNAIKTTEATQVALKKTIEAESKKVVDFISTNAKWKQDLTAVIVEPIHNEISTSVATKIKDAVRDTVRDTVKDTIKTVLATSFRNSFENAFIPAFTQGADRMFNAMNHAVETAMKEVVEETRKSQYHLTNSNANLENEILALRSHIERLEGTIEDLTAKIHMVNKNNQVAPQQPTESPFTLLEKGLINDAVLKALEDKDISITVALLERLTPAIVNAKCSNLVRLCITQQLAADMSVNNPEEGIPKRVEWIKNLVLSLVTGPYTQGADPTYDRNFKTMIEVVLASIQAANKLIFSDNGEENMVQVPQSVNTDLQLLEFVIRSKL